MKLTFVFIAVACIQVSAQDSSKISFSGTNVSVQTVFKAIEKQTGLSFAFDCALLKDAKLVTLNMENVTLKEILEAVLGPERLEFYQMGKTIFIVGKAPTDPVGIIGSGQPRALDVKGEVSDELGEPLVAASIVVKNGRKATLTDEQGRFELKNVPVGAKIEISYLGHENKLVEVDGSGVMAVKLELAINQLDETHVIAYGSTSLRLTIGDIGMVKGEDIERQPVDNVLMALEGRVPGLFITQANGLPGGGINVRIQGQNSVANGNDPLYVIDGVPYMSQLLSTTLGGPLGYSGGPAGSGAGNPFSYINPADIESVEVLKDADATAIYGSRAANGAILITTKKGKPGQTRVMVDFQRGWGNVTGKMHLLSTPEYLQMRREALSNDGITSPASTDYDINGDWDTTRNTDWQKTLIGGTARYLNAAVSISGGTRLTQYFVGGAYHRQTSVFPGNFADAKGSVHFNLNTSSTNQKLKVQLTGSYLVDNNRLPNFDLTTQALQLPPDAPPLYNRDGSLNWQLLSDGTSSFDNPLSVLYTTYQNKAYNLIGNAVISYAIFTGLAVRANLGYTSLHTNEYAPSPLIALDPLSQVDYGINGRSAGYTYNYTNSWIVEPQVDYKHLIGQGKIAVLLGSTIYRLNSNGLALEGVGYNSDVQLPDIRSAGTVSISSTVNSVYKYEAAFGRVNYSWRDKYIVNLSARRDGSSRFGPANQFHDFYSAGLGWVFSEEKYIKDDFPLLSFGRLKGSYGTTGNDQIGDYKYMNLYTSLPAGVPYQNAVGLTANSLPNPYLQWEETKKTQGGIDLGFFKNNRVLISVNYVYNKSSNQLLTQSLPIITGFGAISSNIPATVENTAWELSLTTTNVKSPKFTWSSSVNFTVPKNRLTRYWGALPDNLIIGKPIGLVKLFHMVGVNPATGVYEFTTSNGEYTTSPDPLADNTAIASPAFPTYYGGFQNTFQYKQFRVDFLLQFVKQIAANNLFGSYVPGFQLTNQPASVLARWRKPGDLTAIEKYNSDLGLVNQFSDAVSSDAGYSDASYIRLKNLSVSYSAPGSFLHAWHLYGLRIFLEGQNLFTITRFKGLDPETGNSGLPPLRIVLAGIQIEL